MRREIRYICLGLFLPLSMNGSVQAETDTAAELQDHRQLVEMPAKTRALMRADMQDHLAALTTIFALLADDQYEKAGEVAEQRMGKSTMGKHRESGVPPGRYMPLAMRELGWGMHESASELAEVAKQGDVNKTYAALQN